MKLKVYVLDLEIPARTKRRALLVGIPLAILLGAGALVYAGVPNTFNPGDTLSSSLINQNFSALDARITTLEGKAPPPPSWAWSWENTGSNDLNIDKNGTIQVASFTFTPPAAGYAVVFTHFGNVIKNQNSTSSNADCHVASQLSLTAGQVPDYTKTGYSDVYINGNLLTEDAANGTFLDFNQSVSFVIPVTAASTTVYLNGQMNPGGSGGCSGVGWRTVTMTAIYVQNYAAGQGVPAP